MLLTLKCPGIKLFALEKLLLVKISCPPTSLVMSSGDDERVEGGGDVEGRERELGMSEMCSVF